MCNILVNKPFNQGKEVVGYKVVFENIKSGRFYSPTTGLEVKVRDKIPTIRKFRNNIPGRFVWKDAYNEFSCYHNPFCKNRTMVIVNYADTSRFKSKGYTILKVKGILDMIGEMDDLQCYLLTSITSVEKT